MMNAKKIELFMPDGDPTGCLICDVANWDGKILKIPRSLISHYSGRKELQQTGIYFLIGGQDGLQLYVGEAEKIYRRLAQHMNEDFWNECLVVTKKENALNKAHVKFLENLFYRLAKETGRCGIVNSCVPTKSSISEADEAILVDFSQKVTDAIGVLGYRFLTPLIDANKDAAMQFEIAPTKNHPDISARGISTNEGFVIVRGSTSAKQFSAASSKTLRTKWENLRNNGVVKNDKFVKDYLASSPSTAAAMVLGRNANGLTEWQSQDGRTLKDYIEGN